MRLFYDLFPQTAEAETRVVHVVDDAVIPPGEYAFVESYCTEKDCDCRNVLLNVFDKQRGLVATINYCFSSQGIASRVGLGAIELDPFNRQSKYSGEILKLFKEVVLTDSYRERLQRHYRMVKDLVAKNPEIAEPSLFDGLQLVATALRSDPDRDRQLHDRKKRLRKLQRQARRRSRPTR